VLAASSVPPVAAEYQLIVPDEAVADSIAVPDTQIFPGVVPVTVGVGFTVTVTGLISKHPEAVVPLI